MVAKLFLLVVAVFFVTQTVNAAPRRSAPAKKENVSEYDRRVKAKQDRDMEEWRRANPPKHNVCAPEQTQMSEFLGSKMGSQIYQYNCGLRGNKGQSIWGMEWASLDRAIICRLGSEMGIFWVTCVDTAGNETLAIRTSGSEKLPRWYN